MRTLKKFFWEIAAYIFVVGVVSAPGLLVCLFFDFVANLEINFFDTYSFARILFGFYFLFVNIAYFWGEKRDLIKKIF